MRSLFQGPGGGGAGGERAVASPITGARAPAPMPAPRKPGVLGEEVEEAMSRLLLLVLRLARDASSSSSSSSAFLFLLSSLFAV